MMLLIRLALVLGLASFAACGGCGDKLTAEGKHVPCGNGCVVKNDNNQQRHDKSKCSCSASCPCQAVPPMEGNK
jgi:hypothetical protein